MRGYVRRGRDGSSSRDVGQAVLRSRRPGVSIHEPLTVGGALAPRLKSSEVVIFGDVHAIEETELSVTVDHAPFEGWWEPFTLGVGPAGTYVSGLSDT
jgi:hypothetical protein